MKIPWRSILRIFAAIVATLSIYVILSITADYIIDASDIYHEFYFGSIYLVPVQLAITLISFFIGGLIANSRFFIVPASALQLLFQLLSIDFNSGWSDKPFFAEFADHWLVYTTPVICAVAAALLGMKLSRSIALKNRSVAT